MVCREKKKSRIRAVHMDNLICLLWKWRIDRIPSSWNSELGVMKQGVHIRIEENILLLFGYIEMMGYCRISERV